MQTVAAPNPWAVPLADIVRSGFECTFFERLLGKLLVVAPGARVLDLFCGDGALSRAAGLDSWVGVDLFPPPTPHAIEWDLRNGLGPVAGQPFDVCIASFGAASHLSVAELDRLVGEIAAAAAPGAMVALEALGLHSLEWPALWSVPPGPGRVLPYRLAAEVSVHPWLPAELRRLFTAHGLEWVGALDRTVQAGPKLGEYWPGLPAVRDGLALLARGNPAGAGVLCEPLPPLPAHPAARAHHDLAAARRALAGRSAAARDPRALAKAVWGLQPCSRGVGLGHGVVAIAQAPRAAAARSRHRRRPGDRGDAEA